MAQGAGGGAILGSAAQAVEIMTHRFQNSKLKAAQEKIWEEFVRETNRKTAAERGTSTPLLDELLGKEVMDEITGRTGGVAAGPDMDYVTPEGMRFPAGDVESGTPGMAFSKGGNGGTNYSQYDILDADGNVYHLVEGTRPQDIEIFAGKGGVKPLYPETAEGLTEQFGGSPDCWQHAKGKGIVTDDYGEEVKAEIHWFQEETVGKVKFRIKEWNYEN